MPAQQAQQFSSLAVEALVLALVLSAPIMAAVLLAGLLTSFLRAYTKLSDPGLTYVARIGAVALAAMIAGPWMGSRIGDFAGRMWALIQAVQL